MIKERISFFFFFSFCLRLPRPTEGLHRLRHQRQAADEIHAREQAVLPVQDVEICGVASVRVCHHDFNRPQHSRADDEGQSFLLRARRRASRSPKQKSSLLAQQCFAAPAMMKTI